MSELITVPVIVFDQEAEDGGVSESPIIIKFWNSGEVIELCQGKSEVLIATSSIDKLFKTIKKNLPEAIEALKRI